MASDAAMDNQSTRDRVSVPYPPSWVDRLIQWIGGLPGPSWLFYLIALALEFLLINAVRWVDGSLPVGAFDLANSFDVVYPVGLLAVIQHLDSAAGAAFDNFRPALGVLEAEQARLKYELTTMPGPATLIATVLGLGFTAVEMSAHAIYPGPHSTAFMVVDLALSTISYVLASILIYHTIHQLRLVSRIQSVATRLDLFQFDPLYAFSVLTARTGLVFILVFSFSVAGNPNALQNPSLLALHVFGLVLAAACFVLPLYGMHQRIVKEKQRLQGEANKYLQASIAELHRRVQERDLGDAAALHDIMAGLAIEREAIAKIPTWPWQPGTFAGFVTALSLPVIIFLIQAALKRVLNL